MPCRIPAAPHPRRIRTTPGLYNSKRASLLKLMVRFMTILGFYRKHVCRLDPWPAGLERSFAEAGYQVYNTMNGPSEFTVTGTLKTWDIMDRLPEIRIPTLLVGGRYDE
jgi:pimeloyl-ACP methyl ester carboxylesterase